MKIFIDWLKKAITKIEHDNELYVGNQFSNKFDVYFYNVGTDTDWFPTLTQLAPNGREAGPFSADSGSINTTAIDNVIYLTATFTMGTGYAFMKGVSSFFLYENRITTPHPTKSVIGKFIVTLNNSDNEYFIDDPEFNPKVKEYVDKYSQLRFGGEASTSVIEALDSNQGVWLATDTGYYWYWDYDNNEYVRGNLFQAVSVADNGISTAKIQDRAVTEDKIEYSVVYKINNSIQNGENNPNVNPNRHTNITNSNSTADSDESYGSQVDLTLKKAIVGYAYSSDGTTKHSKIEFDEYHDNTANDDYPRTVIETEYSDSATPERSKITILKDLIELLSDGKISLTAKKNINITSSGDDTNQIEGDINIETKYGGITIETDTDHEITIISGGGINLRDDTYIVNSNLHVDREIYEGNKRIATKEYVDQQIDIIEASGLQSNDIANNLTTNDPTKVLSASQGVVLKGFIDNINTLLQSDDTTLDQLQEIVDYIKNNKSLIDGITTSKVSVSDIIDSLTSTATNKPLSANQGKVLKDALDGVQASVTALTTNKQDKIDSSHKLNADLVAENSSRVFVTPSQKQQIGTNATDISSLKNRVDILEENPTSNVSGTNDGTYWETITIGNDTYAIPSGSSGGSGSGALYEFAMDVSTYDHSGTLIDDKISLTVLIYESNFERFKTEALQMGLTINTPNDLVTLINTLFVETTGQQITSITTDVPAVLLGLLVLQSDKAYGYHNGVYFDVVSDNFFNIVNPLNAGIPYIHLLTDPLVYAYGINVNNSCTLTEYGSSSGGSSSESYYKIVLEDVEMDATNARLYAFMTPSKFSELLTAINTAMGTSLATPNDVITLYDTLKSDTSDNFASLKQVFQLVLSYAKQDNGRTIFEWVLAYPTDLTVECEIINSLGFMANINESSMRLQSCFTNTINGSLGVGGIAFTSSSTLTITEQNNQKI